MLRCRCAALLLSLVAGSCEIFAAEPPVAGVAFAGDGESLVAVSQAGVRVYGWPDLKLRRTVEASAPNLHCAAFSPDGRRLAVGGGRPAEEGTVELFLWPELTPAGALEGHGDSVRSLAWIDDKRLATASVDRDVRVWGLETGDTVLTLRGHSRSVNALSVLGGGELLVTAGADRSLRVWGLKSSELVRNLSQHTGPVNALAVRPADDGLPMVATAAEDRTIRFWQPTIGRMMRYARLESEPLAIAWLPGGRRLAAACVDGSVRIVHPEEVTVECTLEGVDGWAYALAAHPADGSLCVGGPHAQLRRVLLKPAP